MILNSSVAPVLVPTLNDFSPHYREILRIQQADKKAIAALVKAAAAKLKKAFPDQLIESFVAEGIAADEILKKANKWDADLIVLGSHGRTGNTRFLLGSVAQAVLQRAECSVEIVKWHRAGSPRTLAPEQHALAAND